MEQDAPHMADNTLYYGDNLDILRHRIPRESVDLVYLDPPFNSNADYNVIFREQSGEQSAAQIKAFTDTWHWNTHETERAYEDVLTNAPDNVAKMLEALVTFIGRNDLTAYLVMMTERLLELHRVLKPTGSLYLHCDPTASHYLKIVLDTIFGPERFVNEITWQRTSAHSDARQGAEHYGRIHDTILLYTKSDHATWNPQHVPHDPDYIRSHYPYVEENTGRRYGLWDITGPGGAAKGNPYYEIFGIAKYWRYSQANMEEKIRQGKVIQPRPGSVPREKRYLDESSGVPLGTMWTDIAPINSQARERLGYPTQKPLALLERIILASSNPGDVVLDSFCGCGTAIAAAQKLGRRWIGIDITHLAVSLMKSRLKAMFGLDANKDYAVLGEPTDLTGARQLALDDRYQFQYWAVSLVEATAQDQESQRKKGADKGIDGIISFMDGAARRRQTIVVQVKSGHVTSSQIRDLKGVLEREKAAIGLFICLEPPTRDMNDEAVSAGFYTSDLWPGRRNDHRFPRVQLRTIADLLAGNDFELPPRPVQFKQAGRVATAPGMQTPDLWAADLPSAPHPAGDDIGDDTLDDDEL